MSPRTSIPVALTIAAEYLSPLLDEGIDSLVLGCTHYPLLAPTLEDLLGASVRLIDTAAAVADEVARVLATGAPKMARKPSPKYLSTMP
mgnify:CR=1 FL=1